MANNTKGRYWNLLVFENNWKENPNWREQLIDTHLRFCISPLHNKDTWSEIDIQKHPDREEYIKEHIGEPKTPHYHVLIQCDDNTTWKTMKELTEGLGLPVPFVCRAPVGMYHYFTHEFNPEKAQYDPNDIRHYNGSDPADYLMELSKFEIMKYKRALGILIRDNLCLSWDEMESIAEQQTNPNFQYLFQTNVMYFRQYLVDNIKNVEKKEKALKVIDKLADQEEESNG